MKPDLLDTCHRGPILCDGAMGTQLIERGLTPGECGMRWNSERPQEIRAVHAAYAAAGCRLITTNSFGGSRAMLDRHGLGQHTAEWNRAAARVAREALGPHGWVLGDVGPFGDFLEPLGDMTEDGLHAIFVEQITALAEGGADAILVETMSDPAEASVAVRAARAATSLPVAVTFAFQKSDDGFRTMMGISAEDAIAAAITAGADIVGANCGTDLSLEDYFALAGCVVAAAGDTPAMIQPNAGSPKGDPVRYSATPEEMAVAAKRLLGLGITILGGCCGTSPAHLAAMAGALPDGAAH